ncbi:MAG: hypothetical protein Q7R80_01215 [bacterium]|nr:hypothetical protein [bacterium]
MTTSQEVPRRIEWTIWRGGDCDRGPDTGTLEVIRIDGREARIRYSYSTCEFGTDAWVEGTVDVETLRAVIALLEERARDERLRPGPPYKTTFDIPVAAYTAEATKGYEFLLTGGHVVAELRPGVHAIRVNRAEGSYNGRYPEAEQKLLAFLGAIVHLLTGDAS